MGATESTLKGFPTKESHVQAFHTTSEWRKHFQLIKDSPQLMVVDFTATWCGPCKMMESALMELAAEFADVIFVKVDVDELMVVAQEFGVQTMPTFLLIKQGKEVDKVVGANKDELLKKIEKHRVIITAYAE